MNQKLQKEIAVCFPLLEREMTQEARQTFARTNRRDLYRYHFGWGLWVRNHLLHQSSRLYGRFWENGYECRDEMSQEILLQFWCKVRGE